jgi:hypothetical protein
MLSNEVITLVLYDYVVVAIILTNTLLFVCVSSRDELGLPRGLAADAE